MDRSIPRLSNRGRRQVGAIPGQAGRRHAGGGHQTCHHAPAGGTGIDAGIDARVEQRPESRPGIHRKVRRNGAGSQAQGQPQSQGGKQRNPEQLHRRRCTMSPRRRGPASAGDFGPRSTMEVGSGAQSLEAVAGRSLVRSDPGLQLAGPARDPGSRSRPALPRRGSGLRREHLGQGSRPATWPRRWRSARLVRFPAASPTRWSWARIRSWCSTGSCCGSPPTPRRPRAS